MNHSYEINSPTDLKIIIDDILNWCANNKPNVLIIALKGDLGVGKTTFTQMLGKQLGVTDKITSPTFTIMKSYQCNHILFNTLVHIDAYRIESEAEVKPLRLPEVFQMPQTVVCIEWPERISSFIPDNAIQIEFEAPIGDKRLVKLIQKSDG